MKVTKRQKQILWDIFEHERENITIDKLSENLKISSKTISKEIKRLNLFFLSYETVIYSQDKKGIKIKTLYPQEDLINIVLNNQQLSTEDEIKLIILLEKEELKINQIEERFFISRPTIIKVLKTIEESYMISREVSKIKIALSEEQKINYALEILLNYIDTLNYRITFKNVIKHLNLKWQDTWYALNLKEIPEIDKLEYTDNSIVRYYIVKNLMLYFNNETFNIMSILKVKNILNIDFTNKQIEEIFNICSKNLKGYLNVDIKDLTPLVNHLVSIINTKQVYNQNEVYVYLKYLKEFKEKYVLSINIANNIKYELQKNMNIEIGEYEQYFIALHIQIMFEKKEQESLKKVLIICEYGISLSSFVATRLKQKLNIPLHIETISLVKYTMNLETYKEFDLIISTILNFKSAETKVINISPFLIDEEIEKIDTFLKRLESYNVLKKILDQKNLIYIKEKVQIEDILERIEGELSPYIYDKYIQSLRKRNEKEQIPVNNIVFPHGNPKLVKTSKILIVMLDTPILWNGKSTQIIVVNCWNQKFIDDNVEFIKYYYRMLMNEKFVEKLLIKKTSKEAYCFLLNSIKGEKK